MRAKRPPTAPPMAGPVADPDPAPVCVWGVL